MSPTNTLHLDDNFPKELQPQGLLNRFHRTPLIGSQAQLWSCWTSGQSPRRSLISKRSRGEH